MMLQRTADQEIEISPVPFFETASPGSAVCSLKRADKSRGEH
jgi:hypothetical protein